METFQEIKNTDLIIETNFYKWLQEQDGLGEDVRSFIPSIVKYTNYVETPFKGRSDGEAHRSVFNVFWIHKYNKKDEDISSSAR